MFKLSTIQKRKKLNNVFVMDEKGFGGAYHKYEISEYDSSNLPIDTLLEINFQYGVRYGEDSSSGVTDSDLLEVVRHRLKCFQDGEFPSRENEMALIHVEEALLWLNKRVEDRIERNVLGTNQI